MLFGVVCCVYLGVICLFGVWVVLVLLLFGALVMLWVLLLVLDVCCLVFRFAVGIAEVTIMWDNSVVFNLFCFYL